MTKTLENRKVLLTDFPRWYLQFYFWVHKNRTYSQSVLLVWSGLRQTWSILLMKQWLNLQRMVARFLKSLKKQKFYKIWGFQAYLISECIKFINMRPLKNKKHIICLQRTYVIKGHREVLMNQDMKCRKVSKAEIHGISNLKDSKNFVKLSCIGFHIILC